MDWKRMLRSDPVLPLLTSEDEALRYFAQADLEGVPPGPVSRLWLLPGFRRIMDAQQRDGSWEYPGGRHALRSREDYEQIETFRRLRVLVEEHGADKRVPGIAKAAEFMFRHQTDEGDFRGICGRQYSPYYSGAIMELLIKAGYSADPRIERGFAWLESMRQEDGGWAFPMRTVGRRLGPEVFRMATIQPDRTKPFSHLVTGMVLRAYAAHPKHRTSKEARLAGALLAGRFFESDKYADRRAPSFWTSFSYPFWFTDLLSALDSLSLLGFAADDPRMAKGLTWFVSNQRSDGRWELSLRAMARETEPQGWLGLAIARVFKRLCG